MLWLLLCSSKSPGSSVAVRGYSRGSANSRRSRPRIISIGPCGASIGESGGGALSRSGFHLLGWLMRGVFAALGFGAQTGLAFSFLRWLRQLVWIGLGVLVLLLARGRSRLAPEALA